MSISCKQAVDFISKKEEGKLTLSQRYALWRHMAICSLCRLFYKQNKVITTSLSATHLHSDTKMPEADKQEIIRLMQEDAAS